MRKVKYLAALMLLAAATCAAQLTTVTASNITSKGVPLAKGTICFTPAGSVQNGFHLQGVGQVTGEATCRDVVNGAIATTFGGTTLGALEVPDTSVTDPVNICYNVSVKSGSTYLIGGGGNSGYGCVQVSGTTFDFDGYVPNLATNPLGSSFTYLHVQNLTVDHCAGSGCGSGGGGDGAVDSIFGRTGIITAQSGDYSVAQVTNALSKVLNGGLIFVGNGSNVATGVPMSGDCTISNTGAMDCTKTSGTLFATVATSGSYNDLSNKPTLATVATTGSYTDLSNKPTIPSAITLKTNGTNNGSQTTFNLKAGANVTLNDDGTGGVQINAATSGGAVSWGAILGTLSDQADLGTALAAKEDHSALATVATTGAYSDLSGEPQPAQTDAGAAHDFLTAYDAATGLFSKARPAYSDLTGTPTLATVATTGAYSDLTGTPQLAQTNAGASHNFLSSYDASTGLLTRARPDYSDLTNTPTLAQTKASAAHKFITAYDAVTGLFTNAQPDYSDLTGTPALATVATTGAYSDLTGKPSLSTVATTGAYADLTSKPQLAQTNAGASHNFLTSYDAATGLFSRSQPAYSDISGTPQLAQSNAGAAHQFITAYDATTGLFTKARPDYSDLTGTPTLATVATTGAYSDLTGKPSLATVATTGAYSDLSGKPTLPVTNAGASHNFLTSYDSATGLYTKAQPAYSDISGTPSLATVATTGAYSDLSGKPTLLTLGGITTGNFLFNNGGVMGGVTDLSYSGHTMTAGSSAVFDFGSATAFKVPQTSSYSQVPSASSNLFFRSDLNRMSAVNGNTNQVPTHQTLMGALDTDTFHSWTPWFLNQEGAILTQNPIGIQPLNARIGVIGSSVTAGFPNQVSDSYVEYMRQELQSVSNGGPGWINLETVCFHNASCNGSSSSFVGHDGIPSTCKLTQVIGPGGSAADFTVQFLTLGNGQTDFSRFSPDETAIYISGAHSGDGFTLTCQSSKYLNIWYPTFTGGGSFTYALDGGSASSPVSESGSGSPASVTAVGVAGVTNATHTIKVISNGSGPIYLFGVHAFNNTGVEVLQLAASSNCEYNIINSDTRNTFLSQELGGNPMASPPTGLGLNTVMVTFGINDMGGGGGSFCPAGNYAGVTAGAGRTPQQAQADMTSLVGLIQAATVNGNSTTVNPEVILNCETDESGTTTTTDACGTNGTTACRMRDYCSAFMDLAQSLDQSATGGPVVSGFPMLTSLLPNYTEAQNKFEINGATVHPSASFRPVMGHMAAYEINRSWQFNGNTGQEYSQSTDYCVQPVDFLNQYGRGRTIVGAPSSNMDVVLPGSGGTDSCASWSIPGNTVMLQKLYVINQGSGVITVIGNGATLYAPGAVSNTTTIPAGGTALVLSDGTSYSVLVSGGSVNSAASSDLGIYSSSSAVGGTSNLQADASTGTITKDAGLTTAGLGHGVEVMKGSQTGLTLTTGAGLLGSTVTVTSSAPANAVYEIKPELILTTAGAGCTAGTLQMQLSYTNPYSNVAQTSQVIPLWPIGSTTTTTIFGSLSSTVLGGTLGGTTDFVPARIQWISAKAGTSVSFSLQQTIASANCTTEPVVALAYVVLQY